MKAESLTIIGVAIFFALIAPIYWFVTYDPTGTTALTLAFGLCALLGFYLSVVAKQIDGRPEDLLDSEIADGAGELGFFPPYSWWPFFCALALASVVLGIVIGWWMAIIGGVIGAGCLCGWVFEYYRGIHAH